MKQVIQSFNTGELSVAEVPSPTLRPAGILIRTAASLVSAGTERMIVDFAEKNLLQKAQARPDLVRQVMNKAHREGVLATLDSVRNRLDQPLPLGYSSAGIVTAVGSEAVGFRVGDRVACAGAGYARHAEVAYIPRNLAVKVPSDVAFESATFAALGAIAMQGIRQAEVVLGHSVAVIGLGLVGQLAVQMLKAAGCRVFGIDINPERNALAERLGADAVQAPAEAASAGLSFTSGRGFDAVLITADTKSNEPVVLAGELARDRAAVVALGAVGLEIPRKIYYEKELDLRLSRSYGPGRYDAEYEEKGLDYPYAYVRWTEQRNMEAFIQLLGSGRITVEPLISHRFAIGDAAKAYGLISGKTGERFLGVVLTYDMQREQEGRVDLSPERRPSPTPSKQPAVRVGMVGAGTFPNATLLPAIHRLSGLDLVGIVSGSGVTARVSGARYGFSYCASELTALLSDEQINWLVVATRHDLHAQQAIAGLQAGKDVFVEKPLALNRADLAHVLQTQQQTGRRLLVGFNRRFAPMVVAARRFLGGDHRPLIATCRINAGAIPREHWTQDPSVGGGRIIGEACHFIDLLQFLVGSSPVSVQTQAVEVHDTPVDDEALITLRFADGSVGTIIYTAGGDRAFGKERVEVFGNERVVTLDDYRTLELVAQGKRSRQRERLRPDKGYRHLWEALIAAAQSGLPSPISVDEIVSAHLATFAAVESLRLGIAVKVDASAFWREVRNANPSVAGEPDMA